MPANTAIPMLMRAAAPAPLAMTSGTTPRMKAKRCHHDRAGNEVSRLRGRGYEAHALLLVILLRKLDNKDGVLGGESHQRDDADLDIHVVLQTRPG